MKKDAFIFLFTNYANSFINKGLKQNLSNEAYFISLGM